MQKVNDNIFLLIIFAMAGTFLLAASFVFFFIRYQRRMLLQKEAMQKAELAHREGLLIAAIQSQEEERKRIGRDLHDDVGSALSNLRMVLGEIITSQPAVSTTTDIKYKPLIDNIISNVRSISHSLSPPGLELFGLEHTLHELCDSFNSSKILHLEMQNNAGEMIDHIGTEPALAVYRVMQELVANTVKHAAAKNAYILFELSGDELLISYKDDGRGMEINTTKKAGMGLQNIESRLRIIHAKYEIDSLPGKGFSILIKLPVKKMELSNNGKH